MMDLLFIQEATINRKHYLPGANVFLKDEKLAQRLIAQGIAKQLALADREKLLLEVCDKYWVPAWERNKGRWVADLAREPEAAIAQAQQAYLAGTGMLEAVIERIKAWERALTPKEVPGWDQSLVDWFMPLQAPSAPFVLRYRMGREERVWNPSQWFEQTRHWCRQGPQGVRVKSGELMKDLADLKRVYSRLKFAKYEHGEAQPKCSEAKGNTL